MQRGFTFAAVAAAALSWPCGLSAQPAKRPATERDAPDAEAPRPAPPPSDAPPSDEPPERRAPAKPPEGGEPSAPSEEAPAETEKPPPGGAAPPQEESEKAPQGAGAEAPVGEPAQRPLPPEAGGTSGPGQLPARRPGAGAPPAAGQQPPGPVGLFPEPGLDARELRTQGKREEKKEEAASDEDHVFAEDWWSHARPVFEIHGYFRTRAELFHNFSLGRVDAPNAALFPRPADDSYTAYSGGTEVGDFGPRLCTADETSASSLSNDNPAQGVYSCRNKTNAGANIRFRLNPELHVSDNVRVMSQIDLLDNASLGSTPSGATFQPSNSGGYEVVSRSGYTPLGVLDDTIVPPRSAINSLKDSVHVKRAWGEYASPMGELRFGRMPNHWGLGMLYNSGDKYDDDYQSTIDRIMFMTGIKPLDLYIGGAWDFPNEGPLASRLPGGEPYDIAQLDDVNQWALIVMRKQSPQLIKRALAQNKVVINGGTYVTLRKQLLANDQNGPSADASTGANVPNADRGQLAGGYARRDAMIWVPDLWLQLRYKKFRFEAEWAAVLGTIGSVDTQPGATDFSSNSDVSRKLRQFGLATEMEQLLVEDKLHLGFKAGWASGDADAFDPGNVGNLAPGANQRQVNDDVSSTFRFHPNYRIDLILHRYILTRVQGTYYFRPEAEYDFMRKPSGQRLGGGAGFTWSRASQLVQTPGHARDLGIELNAKLYFQSKDGSLNDDLTKMGGFYTMIQYGVLFPLGGLGYQSLEKAQLGGRADTSAAQILRWYMGIMF